VLGVFKRMQISERKRVELGAAAGVTAAVN
jgi:hypothetical protein